MADLRTMDNGEFVGWKIYFHWKAEMRKLAAK